MKNTVLSFILFLGACAGNRTASKPSEPPPLQAHAGRYLVTIGELKSELVIEKGFVPCGLLGGEVDVDLTIDKGVPTMHVEGSDDNILETKWDRVEDPERGVVLYARTLWGFESGDGTFASVSFRLADDGDGAAFGASVLVIDDASGGCVDFALLSGTFEAK